MRIAGLQKTTLVDFPGIVAATVFTRGCSFRCGFCHNPELVIPEQFKGDLISEEEFFNFLLSRVGKLQGICITGGEPLLQPDIDQFISHIKALGFKVKLDTNGSFPDRLEKIIQEGDIDYIAMDIKSPINKYKLVTTLNLKPQTSNLQLKIQKLKNSSPDDSEMSGSRSKHRETKEPKESCHSEPIRQTQGKLREESQQFNNLSIQQLDNNLEDKILKSINLIMDSDIDYEFRTTVCHPYHEVKDFEQIGKMIKGARKYYIQNFVKSKHVNQNLNFEPFTEKELKESAKAVEKFVEKVDIR